jgi:predicted amidohydrolase
MSLLRVGIAQTDIKIGDREGNYSHIKDMLEHNWIKSGTETAVILPEIWDVGYVIDAPGFYGDPEAREASEFLGTLAQKYKCWFTGGSVLAVTDEGAVNRAMAINPDGEYISYYDKAHLISLMDEDKYLRAGDARCHFMLDGIHAAMALCYDLRFCEWIRLYAAEGAEVLFISAEWPVARIDHWRTLLQARAIENMMYVVGCNRTGNSNGTLFGGHSMAVDPWGEILYEAGGAEDFAFVEFDTAKVKKARDFLQVLSARRPELYIEKK